MDKLFEQFAFEPPEGLESRIYSPTYPESEDAIRGQIQGMSNQLRDKLNFILETLSKEGTDDSGADYIGSAPLPGINANHVGGQLREIFALIQNLSVGAIPDGTITTGKLADGAVTLEKISGGSIPLSWVSGSLKIVTGSYRGTGTAGSGKPCSLTFDGEPQLVIISSGETSGVTRGLIVLIKGAYDTLGMGSQSHTKDSLTIEWGENSVSWYSYGETTIDATLQANYLDSTYNYFAIVR